MPTEAVASGVVSPTMVGVPVKPGVGLFEGAVAVGGTWVAVPPLVVTEGEPCATGEEPPLVGDALAVDAGLAVGEPCALGEPCVVAVAAFLLSLSSLPPQAAR